MTSLSKKVFNVCRSDDRITVSFEAFPARSAHDRDALVAMAQNLEGYEPAFLSVTYGAGGSTRESTLDSVKHLARQTSHQIAGHLTCVGASRDDTNETIDQYHALGVRHIVALRGDAPAGAARYEPHPDGYQDTSQLVRHLKARGEFDISVAAYPEKHPDSPTTANDLDHLKAKIDAGADRAITQFFFDNTLFYRFLETAHASGISRQIVPGILLIHDFAKVQNFARRCQATVPDWLRARFAGLEGDLEAQKLAAASVAAEQVLDLAGQGVRQFHFYTLNRPDLAIAMCRCLGIVPDRRILSAA
ncbi:MAG: methylenetetrahydrofolate reductase [Aestuariivirgaceae bacterium]